MKNSDTTPVWDQVRVPRYRRLDNDEHFDAVVVGGGITGATTAYLLKQAGRRVCLLERDRLGSGDTGCTTAHLTCVTDVRLRDLVRSVGREQAALTWYGGMAALDLIEQIVRDSRLDCASQRVPGLLARLDRRRPR